MPWFVLGFAAAIGINSAADIPAEVSSATTTLTTLLLTMGLAAMGLQTSIAQFRQLGMRPLLLAAAGTVFIVGVSLFLIKLV